MEIGLTILGYLLPIIAAALTLFAIAGVRKLLDKLGLERTEKIDDLIDKYVHLGVDTAEMAGVNYLKSRGEKMPSEDKKLKAVKVVMNELEQSGIKDVAEELIIDRIESWMFATTSPEETGGSA